MDDSPPRDREIYEALRMKKLGILLCLLPSAAHAGYFDNNGNDFYQRCATSQNIVCAATAGAYMDMMIAMGAKCTKDAGVNRLQTKDILLKYLAEHPGERHIPLPFSAILAFQDSLGCRLPKGLE
jgi:hypothetical protein